MPVDVKIVRTKDFIKGTVTGALDFTASSQALMRIAALIDQPGDVLVDARETHASLSMIELYRLGVALAAHPTLGRSKLALLAPMSDANQASFLETVARSNHANLRTFADLEGAISQLAGHP